MAYIAIDFETTGLDSFSNQIIEIGAVKFDLDGNSLGEFQKLVKPTCKIEAGAKKVHKISEKMLKDERGIDDVWSEFIEWCGEFDAFVAHNAPFEAGFISQLYDKSELPDFKFIDTLKMARSRAPDLSSYKLTDLIPDLKDAHRALPDAIGTYNLLLALIDTYKSKKLPKTQIKSIFDMFPKKSSNEPTNRQRGYIRALGGNPDNVSTKQEASEYIEELQKSSGNKSKSARKNESVYEVVISAKDLQLDPPKRGFITNLLMFVGVLVMPYIFAWFTLSNKYSAYERVLAFIWLGLMVLAVLA